MGEIDLIMSHQSTLVFVEVCYRHSSHFIDLVTTISCYKRQRLIKTALYYLENIGLPIGEIVTLMSSVLLRTTKLRG